MTEATTAGRLRRSGGGARWLLAPAIVAVVLLGIWVTGGLITDDFTAAMLLSAAWMGLAGLVCLAVAVRRPDLRLPVMSAYLLTAILAGGYLGYTTLVDQEEDDTLIEAAAPAPAEEAPAEQPGRDRPAAPAGPTLVATGTFGSLAHSTSGEAEVVRDGERLFLQLRDYETDPGPDLRLLLSTDDAASDYRDLGAVGNMGNKQVRLPAGIDLEKYSTVLIWCRAFSVSFGSAQLDQQ